MERGTVEIIGLIIVGVGLGGSFCGWLFPKLAKQVLIEHRLNGLEKTQKETNIEIKKISTLLNIIIGQLGISTGDIDNSKR